ncbi:hypothetical protein J6590_090503 [Homalodisca vitripennis]|nr:hypothetical protein J6590_087533 [Homalodisca vitripennis]KAG8329262.1 hypothetical protein J6590_090503 [Homalodisca vitripennis]
MNGIGYARKAKSVNIYIGLTWAVECVLFNMKYATQRVVTGYAGTDESENHQSLERYVTRYLEDVVVHCKQYKNDLQASSLLAVIAAPVHLIQPLLAGIPPMMKMIFQLGQGYVSLAHSGMDALERWQDKLPSDQLKPILYQVLPSFDPYLRSTGILIEEESEEEIKLSKVQQKRAKRIAESTQLSKLQERMLKLLSKLDSATCLSLLRQENTSAVAWTTEPILKLMIPFPDHRLDVYLDALLPRVVALALTSSDRQTKSAACEVLHALVILFTGLVRKVAKQNSDETSRQLFSRLPPGQTKTVGII